MTRSTAVARGGCVLVGRRRVGTLVDEGPDGHAARVAFDDGRGGRARVGPASLAGSSAGEVRSGRVALFAAGSDERHGRWLLTPSGEVRATRRRYRPGTLVLETELETADGAVRGRVPMRMDFPQPFSHLILILAERAISTAEAKVEQAAT